MPPLNSTEEPPSDDGGVTESWIVEHIWLPYVLLGFILLGMALASFIHYHFQNRGKYADKKAVSTSTRASTSAPATENSKLQKPKPRVILTTRGAVDAKDGKAKAPQKDSTKPELFLASAHSKESAPATTTTTGSDGASPASSVSTAAYTNESYDSNCDSDKSLLSTEPAASKTADTKAKKRPRSRSPRRRTSSVEPAPKQVTQKGKDLRKAKSMDLLHRDSTESSGSAHDSGKGSSKGSASSGRRSVMSSPPPSTARLETPDIPDNSRPRTQHKGRSREVNILKVHTEQDD